MDKETKLLEAAAIFGLCGLGGAVISFITQNTMLADASAGITYAAIFAAVVSLVVRFKKVV